MSNAVTIYIALPDEAVDVWRPVQAEPLGGGVYRVAEQAYDRETETWAFEPGEVVFCETVQLDVGPRLAAIRRASAGSAGGPSERDSCG